MPRRLAAILIADVVGYSRLMEADEAGTLAALNERRKTILEPTVREHDGRIVKVMGDGVLVEFASAVNAVTAADELQTKNGALRMKVCRRTAVSSCASGSISAMSSARGQTSMETASTSRRGSRRWPRPGGSVSAEEGAR